MAIMHATENNFKDLVSDEFVLVDFFATWCGPCKMLAETLKEVEKEITIDIIKVDGLRLSRRC